MNNQYSFLHIPMPPSENCIYATSSHGRGRHYTKIAKEFQQDFKLWAWSQIHVRKNDMKQWQKAGVIVEYWFRYDRVYTKKNEIKKIDVTNFQKILFDCFTELTGIDDSIFFEVFLKKNVSTSPQEHVNMYLYKIEDEEEKPGKTENRAL
jgi:Holliday junction resolvase RusA-like endonuclease